MLYCLKNNLEGKHVVGISAYSYTKMCLETQVLADMFFSPEQLPSHPLSCRQVLITLSDSFSAGQTAVGEMGSTVFLTVCSHAALTTACFLVADTDTSSLLF